MIRLREGERLYSEEETYLMMRAESELRRAQEASHPEAVKAHYELAEGYLGRVHCFAPVDVDAEQN
ncbi:hypothetical protein [Allosphingosinicella deserti]|uniref:Uncharacterized protein n=1 Tax=Allosphingosinicella deserti TaxID=2116704 RepID=A0A2P7QDY2_9SPHN|nr:hypothetical protein [Sphingomonas deserti]PSJ36173.1 hypothetical protein C7I55_27565 [Sphingomonas deserti]